MQQEQQLVAAVPWAARPQPGGAAGRLWALARRKPLGAFGALVVLALVALALAAPLIAPYDYREQNRAELLQPPSATHLFGTDNLGRDIFSRVLYGAQSTLYVSLVAVGLGTTLGSVVGLVSGYAGGRTDLYAQRGMDVLMAFPTLILAILTVALLGPTTTNVLLAMAIVFIPTANSVVRGAVLAEKENAYVDAARCLGAGGGRIVFQHLLPNVMAPIIVIASTSLGTAILVESSLSFLGLGPPPPTPTWGGMLSVGSRTFFEQAPWMAIFPGIAISLTILGFNLLGDALRDVLDPRLRGARGVMPSLADDNGITSGKDQYGVRQQPSEDYRGYRTAGIRLSEDLAPELRQGREEAERAALYAYHAFDKAHVVMLTEEAIIPRAVGVAILRAFRDLEAEGLEAVRTRIGGGQHSGETYLIRRLGEEVGGWEHLGRSSNDLSAVGRRIRERDRLLETLDALNALRGVLLALAEAHVRTVLPGYFHWQHAQPITLGHYFASIAQALGRDAQRAREAYARVNESPAGAVILTGTSFPLRRERTAALLGFDGVCVNTLDACQDDDHLLDCFGVLAMLAAHLARLSEDLAYWAGTELGYVEMADRYATGSSILMQMKTAMPPNQVKGAVAGVVGGMVSAYMSGKTATGMHTLDRRYGDAPLDEAFADTLRSLRVLAPALESLTVHAERAQQGAADHFAGATDLAGALVQEQGLPWRTAHQICGILFRHCAERGLTPADLTPALLDEAAVEYFGRPAGLSAASIQRALDPLHFVEERTLLGGPAPAEVQRQVGALGSGLEADRGWLAAQREAQRRAAAVLEEAIDAILA